MNMKMRDQMRILWICTLLMLGGATQVANALDASKIIDTYANIAEAAYADSLATAKTLQSKVSALIAKPSSETLAEARKAWKAARVPYQQTEAFRFGNKIVDDWEGKVNSWPLDEGLIDYVKGNYGTESDENKLYEANVIANQTLKIGGRVVQVPKITKKFLAETLHEAGGVEANVATGYHAIEFLLWGQDLNGTKPGAGNRPASDFDLKKCTGGNCDRRVQYLQAATGLLIDDLTWMTAQWKANGAARQSLMKQPATQSLAAIFIGMGSLSYGELAGERMKLGLLLHDPEEEHDCFSDNTHASHFNDARGIANVYLGGYKRVDGSLVSGPSVSDLVKAKSPEADKRMRPALDKTMASFSAIVKRAKGGETYDQMIGQGNTEGNAAVEAAIRALLAQTKEIERAIAALELKPLEFENSDSLSNPKSINK
jgi:putative iron-regulated protein